MLEGIQGHLPFQEAGTEGELIGVTSAALYWTKDGQPGWQEIITLH